MDNYIRARPDVYFTGSDGSLRSNRALCQTAGLYACDMFIGSTLQIDLQVTSFHGTASRNRRLRGCAQHGLRRARPSPFERPWLRAGEEAGSGTPAPLRRGRKLVVADRGNLGDSHAPLFVEKLDAINLAEKIGLDLAPVMVYADDVTHIVTEEGIAISALSRQRRAGAAIRGMRGLTPMSVRVAIKNDGPDAARARRHSASEDLESIPWMRIGGLLAARSIKDLVRWSGGLYEPPSRFRNW